MVGSKLWLAVLFLVLCCVGCGPRKPMIFDMANVNTTVPSLLVAKKIERPLYIVVDPARVADTHELKLINKPVTVNNFQQFVKRDLKTALEPYFSEVKVVSSADELPSEPHIVGDVKVDRLSVHDMRVGIMAYLFIEVTWSFALRPSNAEEYTFSFAGTGKSKESYKTFEEGLSQMSENAITSMLKEWTENGGIEKLRGGGAEEPAPQPVPVKQPDGGKRI
jgi:hypothetical protein